MCISWTIKCLIFLVMFTTNTDYLSLLFVRWEKTVFSKIRRWTLQLCDFHFRDRIAVKWESLAVSISILHLSGWIYRSSIPVTGLEWPRGYQEVKVPIFHDNDTGRW